MINTTTIAGNLTRDIELRSTASGFTIGFMTVAVNDRVKNKQTGEYEDKPYFFDAKLLGTRAEKLAQYLTKGTKVTVQGKLVQERWEDNAGNHRSRVCILVDDLDFTPRSAAGREDAAPAAPASDVDGLYGQDIPF